MANYKAALTFEINQTHIGKLFSDVLGIVPNRGSAFFGATPTDMDLSDVYREQLKNEEFLRALRIVAQPDLYVVNRIGGGSMGLEEVRIHRKKGEGEYVVATAQADDGTCVLQVYENYKAYLAWWMEKFAGKNDETIANYVPPKVTLEQFLFVLHAIDSFRIVSYRNLLNHVYMEKAYITYAEFAKTMADSIKSNDLRWMLPSFMRILPGFEKYNLEMSAENAAFLVGQGIMENAKLVKNDELVLVFGEGGLSMGVEFFRFWIMSSGFEINVLTLDGFAAKERLFNAPTAISNHFVRLETGKDGKTMVNHQTYTREQLEVKLDELFGDVFAE